MSIVLKLNEADLDPRPTGSTSAEIWSEVTAWLDERDIPYRVTWFHPEPTELALQLTNSNPFSPSLGSYFQVFRRPSYITSTFENDVDAVAFKFVWG